MKKLMLVLAVFVVFFGMAQAQDPGDPDRTQLGRSVVTWRADFVRGRWPGVSWASWEC